MFTGDIRFTILTLKKYMLQTALMLMQLKLVLIVKKFFCLTTHFVPNLPLKNDIFCTDERKRT